MTMHDLLAAFDALPPDQQQQFAVEILRRMPDLGDLSDADRDELAAEVFRKYDEEEAVDENSLGQDVRFPEETITILSDGDRFLELINSPPAPNEALRKAMSKHRKPDV